MRSRIILFLMSLLVWCILNWPPDLQIFLAGAAASLVVTAALGSLFVTRPHIFGHPARVARFCFVYVPVFVWEMIKANLDVAYRVLHPSLPIEPGIVRIRTSLRSEVGITFLANSITLTPGTLTVDLDVEEGVLYVHWIKVRSRDTETATRLISEKFERILTGIFEEGGVGR